MTARRAWLSWSSGKDAATALAVVREDPAHDLEVVGLLTTLDEATDRVAVHGVPRALLQAQADALGLPLHAVALPWPASNAVYEERVGAALVAARLDGVDALVLGDLHLADVRAYREQQLAGTGLEAVFPLWGRPTDVLAREQVGRLRAVVCCVDPSRLDASVAGRAYDGALLDELPAGVDPCGENGELHTFVTDAPGFAHPVAVRVTGRETRDGLVVATLTPAPPPL